MQFSRRQYSCLIFLTILFPALGPAQTNVVPSRVLQPVDTQHLVTLRGNVHPLALPQFDRGPAPDDLPAEHMLMVLQRSTDQETSLRLLLDQQQVASATQFHQWLTPEEFGNAFGPSDSDLKAVTGWLTSQGFRIDSVSAGRTIVEFSGTAGQVRQSLGTEIHKFHVNGADRWANVSDPEIPAALAPVVAGIASLNNFPRKPLYRMAGKRPVPSSLARVLPLFSYPGTCSDGSQGCYYLTMGPGDFAKIYNMYGDWTAATPIDGTGVTIAVVGETNIKAQDVADFRTMFGLPASNPNIIVNGPDPGILTDGEEIESDLDVEWSGGVAKGATIDFVVSESTETSAGIDLSALYIVDNDLAPILSESYGGCEQELGAAGNAFYNALWEQAAAEGITVILGAGDSGSAGCDSANSGEIAAQNGLGVSGFASTPFNVAVGGTDFNLTNANVTTYWQATNGTYQASALSYIPETTWNYSCASSGSLTGCTPPPDTNYLNAGIYLAAGSGGVSQVYPKPSWQTGTGVPADSARDIPDISLVGAEYYVICDTDLDLLLGGSGTSCDLNSPYSDFAVVSGTSASAQAFAGVMALVVQQHGRQGNANYVFYPLAVGANTCASNASAPSNSSCVFYDTQVGNNSVICAGGSPECSNSQPGQYGIVVSKGAAAYPTTAGYDVATGLGSVNVGNLVKNWKSNFTLSTTSLSLSTSPSTNPIQLVHGQSVNFNVTVGASSGTPSGDVSLIAQAGASASGVTPIGPFTLSGGAASGSTNMLPGGSYTVTAHYPGNGTFGSSDSSPGIPVTVTKENSKAQIQLIAYDPNTGITTTDPASVAYGSLYLLRMNVTNSSGNLCANETTEVISYACPTGTLTLSPTPTDLNAPASSVPGQYTLNNLGYAEDQYIEQPAGNFTFTANYAGDNSFNSSASAAFPVDVTLAPTALTLNVSPATTTLSTSVQYGTTLTDQSYGVNPTGTIQYYKNGSLFYTDSVEQVVSPLGTSGPSQYSFSESFPAGSTVLTANYSGDSNYAASTSAPVTITVSDFSVASNPTSVNISAPGQSGTASISVTPLYGFTGVVNLSVVSGCPTGATCSLATPSVNVTGASPVAETLTIATTASSATPPSFRTKPPSRFRLPAPWMELLAALLILFWLSLLRKERWRPALLIAATAAVIACAWIACGGGSGASQTPPAPAPAVSLSPGSLTFSAQSVGTTSPAQSITLTNTGNASLAIASMSLGGTDQNDFAQTSNCPGTLTSNTSCAISVKFSPSGAGTRSGSLSIADNASGSPHIATLTGTGSEPPTPAGTYSVTLQAVSGVDTHNLTLSVVVQ